MITSLYVNRLIIKDKNKQLKHVTNENRGLRKTIKRTSKAAKNNHDGLMYWKNKYLSEHKTNNYIALQKNATLE